MRIAAIGFAIAALAAGCILAAGSGKAAGSLPFLYDPAWSPDGKLIAFADRDEGAGGSRGDLYVMNADGTNMRKLTDSTGGSLRGARYPAWSPDGTRVV